MSNVIALAWDERNALRKPGFLAGSALKGAPYPKMDHKVSLNLVKLDQLCAIVLMKREEILRVLLKMVAMATSYSLWKFYLIALTPTTPALLQSKI